MKPKSQRLILVSAALAAVLVAVLLSWAFLSMRKAEAAADALSRK